MLRPTRHGVPRLAVGFLGVVLVACASDDTTDLIQEVGENVVTLQSGTMTELRELRGQGPFRRYEQPPEVMLEVVEEAIGHARGLGGREVGGVWVSRRRGEVVAKEREPDKADSETYGLPFRSAVLVVVHPVQGEPNVSRVEIHSTQRGPFHKGRVAWQRDLPRWIDDVLRQRRGEILPLR